MTRYQRHYANNREKRLRAANEWHTRNRLAIKVAKTLDIPIQEARIRVSGRDWLLVASNRVTIPT